MQQITATERPRRGPMTRRRVRVAAVAAGGLALGVLAGVFPLPASASGSLPSCDLGDVLTVPRGYDDWSVTLVDRLPPLERRGSLGQPIPLDSAPFRLLLPSGRRPEQVYAGDGGYWLRYPGLLLFELESGPGAQILKKAALGTTDVEYVDVDGEPGIWIGGRHAVYLPGGKPRAAGHVLIWKHGRLTLRLEAAVGRERALAIARSVR